MEIEEFFKIYQNSVWNKNTVAMQNLYENPSVLFDTWDRGYVSNSTEWNKIIDDWFNSLGEEMVKVDFEMVTIHRSENIGFASALIQFQATSIEGVVLRSMRNRLTVGFEKSEKGWKAIHQHMSAPISSKDLTGILKI
jgi:ketosteroid isomerase-like protein